jgi:hypothetical protein
MKNNVSPLAIRSTTPAKKPLRTGTQEAIKAEYEKHMAEKEKNKNKPPIATTKATTTNQKSSVNVGAHRTASTTPKTPQEVIRTKAENTQLAWEHFADANEIRKKNDSDYTFGMYLKVFGIKDEGTYQDMKKKLKEHYLTLWNEWDPYKAGLKLNEQNLAIEVRAILTEGYEFLDKNIDEQIKKLGK